MAKHKRLDYPALDLLIQMMKKYIVFVLITVHNLVDAYFKLEVSLNKLSCVNSLIILSPCHLSHTSYNPTLIYWSQFIFYLCLCLLMGGGRLLLPLSPKVYLPSHLFSYYKLNDHSVLYTKATQHYSTNQSKPHSIHEI